MNPPPPAQTIQIKVQLPQFFVWVSGILLHPENYTVELSRIRDHACSLTVKETDKLHPYVADLFRRAEADGPGVETPGLWLLVCPSTQVPNLGIVIQKYDVVEAKWMPRQPVAPADAAEKPGLPADGNGAHGA